MDYILEAERKVDSKESTDKTSSNSPVKLRKKVTVVEEDITSGALIPNRTAEKRKSDRSAIKSNHDRKYSAPEVLKEVKKEKKKGSFRLEVSDYNKSYEKLVLFINDCLDETRTLNV